MKKKTDWVLHSASTFHVRYDSASFVTLHESEELGYIIVENNQKMKVMGIRRVHLRLNNGSIKTVSNVRYMPS